AALLCATLLAGPALAQVIGPAPVLAPKAKAAPKSPAQATPAAPATPAAQARPMVAPPSKAPEPTFDEGTALRIAAAMLSYSAIEVRGGWPTLPATAARLALGANGPEVTLLRERLAM